MTHVELLLEEVKAELHTKDVQCSELKAIVEKQKQSMMQRASQVSPCLVRCDFYRLVCSTVCIVLYV